MAPWLLGSLAVGIVIRLCSWLLKCIFAIVVLVLKCLLFYGNLFMLVAHVMPMVYPPIGVPLVGLFWILFLLDVLCNVVFGWHFWPDSEDTRLRAPADMWT